MSTVESLRRLHRLMRIRIPHPFLRGLPAPSLPSRTHEKYLEANAREGKAGKAASFGLPRTKEPLGGAEGDPHKQQQKSQRRSLLVCFEEIRACFGSARSGNATEYGCSQDTATPPSQMGSIEIVPREYSERVSKAIKIVCRWLLLLL